MINRCNHFFVEEIFTLAGLDLQIQRNNRNTVTGA